MIRIFLITVVFCFASICNCQKITHRSIIGDEVAVRIAGSYAEVGVTYVLENDISSERSTLFLGKDITLDLNGYTIKYADAKYEHILNSGFEEGLKAWDLSKAPGAKVLNTADIHVFLGEKLLSLEEGD